MRRVITTVAGSVCIAASYLSSAEAADSRAYSDDASGAALAQEDEMRSLNGLMALLVATTDMDWREQLQNASRSAPHFKTANTVGHGKKIAIFVLAGNPKLDQRGQANVRVSYVMINPQGVRDAMPADLECIVGAVERGVETNVRNCKADLTFVGDDNDPSGLWEVEATVTDVNRSTSLLLRARFRLE